MGAAAEWAQHREAMTAAPLFGGRRSWLDYSFATTGYGSVERSGPRAYRVTIVRPGDPVALRQHHRLMRSGRLTPGPFRPRLDDSRVHVVDREELSLTRADAHDSWLVTAQHVARLCGADDEVARIAGAALRSLLWSGRVQLGSEPFMAAIDDLRRATEELAVERTAYRAAVDRWVAGEELARSDIESIEVETRVLAKVRQEWDRT
jgi:hypothetical protein